MSDIVLKDKNGVKNTYSDITAINIPDGKGGFVKYSLGSTLPEYDGTVIIEKAESVLGLRKLTFPADPSTVGSFSYTDGIENEEIYNQYYCEFEPFDLLGYECIGVSAMWSYTDIMGDTEPNFIIRTDVGYMLCSLSFAIENGLEGLVVNITYCNNKTMEEWLLANTEGVSA